MKNKNVKKKDNLLKYFAAGVVAAVILLIIFSLLPKDESISEANSHVWSPEMDSLFVKNCYVKYKPQIKDDLQKQENIKTFCRCMLEKVKTKYEEKDMGRVRDAEIKQWDIECREKILNPNNLKTE